MKHKVFEYLKFSDEEMTDRLARHVLNDEKHMQKLLKRSEQKYDCMKENPSGDSESETYTVEEKTPRRMTAAVLSLAACAVLAIGIGGVYHIGTMSQGLTPGTVTEQPATDVCAVSETSDDHSYSAELGIRVYMEEVSPGGGTLVIQKTEGSPTGEVEFGSYYFLEQLADGVWERMPYIIDEEVGWTSEAYMLTDNETRWETEWGWIYGSLSPGEYRIGKQFMDFRGSGDFDEYLLYAGFTISEEATDIPSVPQIPAPDMVTMEGIYNAMLNSIDYFDKASGKILYSCNPNNIQECLLVEFETELDTSKAYSHTIQVNVSNPEEVLDGKQASIGCIIGSEQIAWSSGEMLYEIDPVNLSYRCEASVITRNEAVLPEGTRRHWFDKDGIPCWQYRTDPTNAPFAGMCLQPQEIAFNCLTNFDTWEITGGEQFQGRKCIVLTGRSEMLSLSKFIFYVDQQNGTLLQYRGYDHNGVLCDFLYAQDIAFDDDAAAVRSIDLTGYRKLSEFDASSKNEITEQDDIAILRLCNKACHKWARLYNGLDETDFSELVTTDALNQYLMQSAANSCIMCISTSESAVYESDQIDYNGKYATVKGIYRNPNGADGMFIFILENIDGTLYINDMIYDAMDTFDNWFRFEFVQSPCPDFWSDPEQAAEMLEKASGEHRNAQE